jgi:protein gp37
MENSKIEWTDHTFNPWIGCTKVSAGCTNCYAETLMDQRYGRARWGKGNPRTLTSDANWRKPLAWNRDALMKGTRYRVFCASLADVFDPEVDDAWRDRLVSLIETTQQLDWLLLTKRPERALAYSQATPLPRNVWMGTSVEHQEAANLRIPILLQIRAAIRFLSIEPLLGAVDLKQWAIPVGAPGQCVDSNGQWWHSPGSCKRCRPAIDWVIVGGESGRRARSMQPEWVRSLRDQCLGAGVPFHFKQWGEYGEAAPGDNRLIGTMVRVGKKTAGRMLDDKTWDGLPTVTNAE